MRAHYRCFSVVVAPDTNVQIATKPTIAISESRRRICSMVRSGLARFAIGVLLVGLLVPGARAVSAPEAAAVRQSSSRPDRGGVARDLAEDERFGGHTLERHVGRTDNELRARLARERGIAAASTYTDAETASTVVGAALAQSARRITNWAARQGPRPNLVVNFTRTTGPPIGRSLRRGRRVAEPCYRALVVLRWNDRSRRWYVLTSYPEGSR